MADRFPFSSIPSGWYAVGLSRELPPGAIVSRSYFGGEIVLFRTASGAVRAIDAHCPHMGGHFAHGGRVEGESIRCPFHGFCFDAEGACVSTPYGTPSRLRLQRWPARENGGLLLVYYGAHGENPEWEVPPLDRRGWSRFACKRYPVRSHPQETTENSVDFGHFSNVHNFLSAEMIKPVQTNGPLLTSGYSIVRSLEMIGLPKAGVRADFDVFVWGLGYSLVEARVPRLGIQMRYFVLPVPIDRERIDLRLGCMVRRSRVPGVTSILLAIIFKALCVEVEQDIPIWNHKAYVDPPMLAKGDGPIPQYRRWARQFYPDSERVDLPDRLSARARDTDV